MSINVDTPVVIPFIDGMLRAETSAWGDEHEAQFLSLGSDDEAYYRTLCHLWRQSGDLLIVEQDVVPADGVVEEMLQCEFEWCSSPYLINGELLYGWGLGCTKLSAALRQRHPDMALHAGRRGEHDPEPERAWWMLDVRLGCLLSSVGCLPHSHAESTHLHGNIQKEHV